MNPSEAIKSLNGYGENLVSLSLLLSSNLFQGKDDEQVRTSREGLIAQIKQKRIDGKWVARERS